MNRANGRQYIGDIRDGAESCAMYHDSSMVAYYGSHKTWLIYGIVTGAYNYDFIDVNTMVEVQSKLSDWNDTIEKDFKKGAEIGMKLNKYEKKRNLYMEVE